MASPISYDYVESPLGPILIAAGDDGIRRISFQEGRNPERPAAGWTRGGSVLERAREEIAAYFAGRLFRFDLPLAPEGSDFDRLVWKELARVPYGTLVSYGELARRIGRPNAARAVGGANGRNPLPIVLPCHRVVGSSGRLTGYACGLEIKERLIELERRFAARKRAADVQALSFSRRCSRTRVTEASTPSPVRS